MDKVNQLPDSVVAIEQVCEDVIGHLNSVKGSGYSPRTLGTINRINRLLDLGYTSEDMKAVIDAKSAEWLHIDDMRMYIRPSTLFDVYNFQKYLLHLKK